MLILTFSNPILFCKAVHVKNTWGSHCDKLLFMSTEEDKELGAVALEV